MLSVFCIQPTFPDDFETQLAAITCSKEAGRGVIRATAKFSDNPKHGTTVMHASG